MLSDFMIAHPSGPFIELSNEEWKSAIRKYPELDQKNDDVTFLENSATSYVILGQQPYFDNQKVLEQFERLFKILEFKEDLKNHEIHILIDNATTHSTKQFYLKDFGKGHGTRCPVPELEWDENGIFF
jgi:hypothetical protein